jgi:hypothetical protein
VGIFLWARYRCSVICLSDYRLSVCPSLLCLTSTLTEASSGSGQYRGTSRIRNTPPLYGHSRALDIVLMLGTRSGLFLMSEVPIKG